jgi:hypothetical protein
MVDKQSLPSFGPVFRRAAEVLRERGWCQGQLRTASWSVCALGALQDALEETGFAWLSSEAFEARRQLEEAVTLMFGYVISHGVGVGYWNDEEDREQTEVEKALLFAADRADFADGPR